MNFDMEGKVHSLKIMEEKTRARQKRATEGVIDAFEDALIRFGTGFTPREKVQVAAYASWVIQNSYVNNDSSAVSATFKNVIEDLEGMEVY